MEIRRSYDRLISTMGFPILVRCHLYIELGPRAAAALRGLEYDGRLFMGCTHLSNWRPNQTTGYSLVIIFTQPFHACNYLSNLWLRLGFPKCKHSMAKLPRHVQLHHNVGRKSKMTDKLLLRAYQLSRSTWRFQFVDENSTWRCLGEITWSKLLSEYK